MVIPVKKHAEPKSVDLASGFFFNINFIVGTGFLGVLHEFLIFIVQELSVLWCYYHAVGTFFYQLEFCQLDCGDYVKSTSKSIRSLNTSCQ